MLSQAQMSRKNTHACTQASSPSFKNTEKNKQGKFDLDAGPWCLFTFSFLWFIFHCWQFGFICVDVVSICFAFRLFYPSRMCSGTHGRGCVAFWQRGWSRFRGCECGRRPWRHSETSGWRLPVLWRSSSLCSAGGEGAGGPACSGTSLPWEPSRQTSVGGIYMVWRTSQLCQVSI